MAANISTLKDHELSTLTDDELDAVSAGLGLAVGISIGGSAVGPNPATGSFAFNANAAPGAASGTFVSGSVSDFVALVGLLTA